MTVVLTGRDIEKKRALVLAQLERALGGREGLARRDVAMSPPPPDDPPSNEAALAKLTVRVASDDEARVGKRFARAVVELALASVPGFTLDSLPEAARPRLLYCPTTVSARHVAARVLVGGEAIEVPAMFEYAPFRSASLVASAGGAAPGGDVVRVAFGRVFGTRSGDKGGNATLGVFARSDEAYAFLRDYLDADRLAALLPDVAWYPIERFELPGLRAVGFVIRGLLGDGVSSSIRFDPQAKTLGEYLGARLIEVPRALLR